MNYYPFHIGDYVSATRHLSWEEDAAYRRLLDTYYTTEKPLPIELRAVCRLVLAATDAQREAVETVLGEFFELTDEGWINRRADDEISSMRDKQLANEERATHETERMRRHRERRAEMFKALRDVGIVPAWDVPMKELQRLADKHCNTPETKTDTACNAPATHLQREQVVSGDAPATAIPTPTPTPTPVNKERARAPTGSRLPADWELPDEWAAWAKKNRPELDPIETAQRFADYWTGVAGAKGRKADWLATWRNWVRNEKAPQLRPAQALSFAQQDEIARRKAWEEMTGRKWPTDGSGAIDVTPLTLEIDQ